MTKLPKVKIYKATVYAFFLTIILQNTIGLIITGMGMGVPLLTVYFLKDVLLVFLVIMTLMGNVIYKFGRVDKVAFVIMAFICMAAIMKGGGIGSLIFELRFYLAPVVMFFIGRNLAPFRSEKEITTFVLIIGSIYTILGLVYMLIDREMLLQMGMTSLLSEKLGQFGRTSMIGGFPLNFFYYSGDGTIYSRAFGAHFDPLATAFFGAVLFFYLLEAHKRLFTPIAKFVAIGVGIMILLSMTRSIIFSILIALLLFQLERKELRLNLFSLIVLILGIVGSFIFIDLGSLQDQIDPSSAIHLSVYTELNLNNLIFGSGIETGKPRGSESVYLTILYEHGIGVFFIYLVWIIILYRWFFSHFMYPYSYAASAAMLVYAIASLTTEHWFSISSGTIFWFLIGNSMTLIQSSSAKSKIVTRY